MKVLHINVGAENGGGKTHIISLLSQFNSNEAELLVLEDGIVAQEARALNIKVTVIPQTSRYDLSVLKKIIVFINKNNFDLVHTHGPRANFLINKIRNKLNAKWVITVHSNPKLDFMNRGLKGKLFTFLNLKCLKKADALIAVTENFKKMLIEYGLNEKNIYVVYNGIIFDDTPIKKRNKNSIFTMSYVARLHPIKGHSLLFKSLSKTNIPNYKLNIIGDGDCLSQLKKEASELKIDSFIHFLGFKNRKEIDQLVSESDITLLSSYSESFPLVLLESANQHVPFISTAVGDVHKLIPNEKYGWLVPIDNQLAYTKALDDAYRSWLDDTLIAKGENIYKLASTNFSLDKLYQDTKKIYLDVLRKE